MSDIPVERRTYYQHPVSADGRACPVCHRSGMTAWHLRRDRQRHVWRRWVCLHCQAHEDVAEDESA